MVGLCRNPVPDYGLSPASVAATSNQSKAAVPSVTYMPMTLPVRPLATGLS
jgi:hypothetical protein